MYLIIIRLSSNKELVWRSFSYTMQEIINGIVTNPESYEIPAGETIKSVTFHKLTHKAMISMN